MKSNCAILLVVLLSLAPVVLFAQDGGPLLTLDDLNTYMNEIYGAAVILWGYIGRVFKWKKSPIPFVFVVIVGGLVLGGAFVVYGGAQVKPLVLSFLMSLGTYATVLKPLEDTVKAVSSKEAREETGEAWKEFRNAMSVEKIPTTIEGLRDYFTNK